MKSKIFMSMLVIVVALSLVVGGTMAWFTDTETSTGNTFTAGTLDLKINGGDINVVAFNVTNMAPGAQPTNNFRLSNAGSIAGYLNISAVTVVNTENGIIEPEASAGDETSLLGELGNVVNIRLYFDNDADGYFSTGDVKFYDGLVSSMPASFIVNKAIAVGAVVKINAVLDWWNTPNDNLAQGDTMKIDFTFNLSQNILP